MAWIAAELCTNEKFGDEPRILQRDSTSNEQAFAKIEQFLMVKCRQKEKSLTRLFPDRKIALQPFGNDVG